MAFPDPHSSVLVAFKRYGGFVREAGEKEWREVLPRNQMICPICGRRIMTARLHEHSKLPECWVEKTVQVMREQGWEPAPRNLYVWAKQCGFEIKHEVWRTQRHGDVGPAEDLGREQAKQTVESNSRIKVEIDGAWLIERGPWIRREVKQAIDLLACKPLKADRRVALLKRMLSDQDFLTQVEVLFRLNKKAKIPKEWIA